MQGLKQLDLSNSLDHLQHKGPVIHHSYTHLCKVQNS